jgi:hypothetical protein
VKNYTDLVTSAAPTVEVVESPDREWTLALRIPG